MDEEMQALSKNETWDLIPSSPHQKVIGCGWIFIVKYNVDGFVNHFKARLIVKGYAQTHRVNYEKIFAQVAKMTIVRTIISVGQQKGGTCTKWTSRTPFYKVN